MVGKTERVVLVKGGANKWYEQAIFIVNPQTPKEDMPVDFVAEAEKIVNDFNLKRRIKKRAPAEIDRRAEPILQKRESNFVLNFLMIIACIAVAAILAFGVMGG